MELIVRLGDRVEQVRVAPATSGRLAVTIGERRFEVDRAAAGLGHSLLIDGEQWEVTALPRELDLWISSRQGGALVSVTDPLSYLAEQGGGSGGSRRSQRVTAYMPGRVVEILVEEGQSVAAGQGLVVLEAMKMQNEIQAESAATVLRVLVTPGQTVEGGDVLFELE